MVRQSPFPQDQGAQVSPQVSSQVHQSRLVQLTLAILASLLFEGTGHTDIKIVQGQGQHLLGRYDTKAEAIRLATEAAKRDALDQVGTYLESVTVTSNFDITREEIRTYTAGVVTVLDQRLSISAQDTDVTFTVSLTAQINTDDVAESIKQLRHHEEARRELASLRDEVDALQQELDLTNQALRSALTSNDATVLTERRAALLDAMHSNNLVQQAWSDWMRSGDPRHPYGYGASPDTAIAGLLAQASQLNPHNPHIPLVTTIITTRLGAPSPPAPPHPPAPPGHSQTIPLHQQLVTPLQVPANAIIGNRSGNWGAPQAPASSPHQHPRGRIPAPSHQGRAR